MKKNISDILLDSMLCSNMTVDQVNELLKESVSQIKTYSKNDFIFHEGDRPTKLYVLVEGKVSICKDTITGKRILIANIQNSGEFFGEVYLFIQKEEYDMYAFVAEDTTVLEISNQLFTKEGVMSQVNYMVTQNLLRIFAEKAYMLSSKMKILGSGSIRQKIVRYLFEQQEADGTIHLGYTREELADYLHVTRPSLSREMGKMQDEGIIEVTGRNIIVLNEEAIEEYL
ncbi:MAG TPA: Crp/Fnr family transcriptional regulator [Lachnospiraceae bacterium]|nr:Crp/Fnr family transcriptional regulator [Lachnospiraceae bacterium]